MENEVKKAKTPKVVVKKKFFKHGDPAMSGFFNSWTWKNMTDGERAMWTPDSEDEIFEDPGRFDRHQSMRNMDIQATKDEHLRLQEGSRIDLLGVDAVVLKWGPKQHLISLDYERKHPGKPPKFGLMARSTKDTAHGIADTISTFQPYQSFNTKAEAEAAYQSANK